MRITGLQTIISVVVFILTGMIGIVGTAKSAGQSEAAAEEVLADEMNTAEVEAYLVAVEKQLQADAYLAELKRIEEEKAAMAKRVATAPPATTRNDIPSDGSRWDQLALCEAGGDWARNSGNGFGGGLQFMHQPSYSTWLSFGGGEFARHPWEASREQQIIVAERVLASSGWNAWPGCSKEFGWL